MERIFVVPAGILPRFQGFMPADETVLDAIRKSGFFTDRAAAENEPAMKQIIPYIVFSRDGMLFTMRRLEKGGEKRLHNKTSIGIGGHINHEDGEPIEDGLRREFFEEVDYQGTFRPRLLGFINDDSDDVGKVHFGLAYVVEGDAPISVREKDVLEGRMQVPDDINRESPEKWSRIVLDALMKDNAAGKTLI
ncbi:MAG: NUDIX domain-containing protein [Candidatus Aenigmarchaeota archaeon]|nr:NUDIX domain-containing protein [Candidatus Aenigmarchaeota archaeon]